MGGAFCNRLVVANEATKNIKIKIRRTTDATIGGRDGTTKHPEDKRMDDTSDDGMNVQWGRGRGGIDWGSIMDMAIRGVPLQNTTINKKQAASMKGRRDGMRAQWRVQGECDLIVLGAIELGEGGKHK